MSIAGRPQGPTVDLIRELRTFSGEIEQYVLVMSQQHTIHRTDLSAIAAIMDGHGATPGSLSRALGLSPPATSALLDRLERAGHVQRHHDQSDRRTVRLSVTDQAMTVGGEMFGLLAKHMRPELARHDDQVLAETATLLARLTETVRAARAEAKEPPASH